MENVPSLTPSPNTPQALDKRQMYDRNPEDVCSLKAGVIYQGLIENIRAGNRILARRISPSVLLQFNAINQSKD